MFALSASGLEAVVNVITSAILAISLVLSGGREWMIEAAALAMLTGVAYAIEAQHGRRIGAMYQQRAAETSGIAVGLLSLPWISAALVGYSLRNGFGTAFLGFVFLAFLSASAATVLLLLAEMRATFIVTTPARKETPPAHPSLSRTGTVTADQESGGMVTSNQAHTSYKDTFIPSPTKQAEQTTWLCTASSAAILLSTVSVAAVKGGSWVEGLAVVTTSATAIMLLQSCTRSVPKTLTLGEAIIVTQAFTILAVFVLLMTATATMHLEFQHLWTSTTVFVASLLICSILGGGTLIALLTYAKTGSTPPGAIGVFLQDGISSVAAQGAVGIVCISLAIAAIRPALFALGFVLASWRRLAIVAYWLGLLAVSLPTMHSLARSDKIANIILRKGYHILAVSLFVPALIFDQELLGIALAIAFAGLVAVEVLRLSGVPGISPNLQRFMSSFTDARDSGLILITHFTLLLGMAFPVWLSNALISVGGGSSHNSIDYESLGNEVGSRPVHLWPGALAGIMIIGLGDTAASAVGRCYGRTPICVGSKKTVKGTTAGIAATMIGWVVLMTVMGGASATGITSSWTGSNSFGGGFDVISMVQGDWIPAFLWLMIATGLSSLFEAVTGQLDNLVVPIHYFALLCCM